MLSDDWSLLLATCDLLYVTYYLNLFILQELVSFTPCCTSRNFFTFAERVVKTLYDFTELIIFWPRNTVIASVNCYEHKLCPWIQCTNTTPSNMQFHINIHYKYLIISDYYSSLHQTCIVKGGLVPKEWDSVFVSHEPKNGFPICFILLETEIYT